MCAAKYGISDATFYNWRSRYGGMEVSDARKLNALEDENRRLKWSADRSRFVDAQRGQQRGSLLRTRRMVDRQAAGCSQERRRSVAGVAAEW